MTSSVYEAVGVSEQPAVIRVLELHPGQPASPLKGSLVRCCLDDKALVPYTALSYTWGAQTTEDTTIQLQDDAQPVPVWANLKHALHTLRSPEVSVRLWIDAICINQSDVNEKDIQIPLMGRIYAQASRTVIWLNPANEESALGMASIRAIGEERRSLGTTPSSAWLEAAFTLAHWTAMGSLMESPWWGRIWIVQEALMSRNPCVYCGDAAASLDDFVALEEVRYTHTRVVEGLRQIPPYPLSVMLSSWAMNLNDATSGRCPLMEWLVVTERFGFTKPRDRFYALRALSKPSAQEAMVVDYDETTTSDALLNVKMAIHCLEEFRILLPLQFPYGADRPPGLPSWCPDWYRADNGYQSFAFNGSEGRLEYQACGLHHTQAPLDYHGPALTNETAAECALWLRGWPFDAVEYHDAFPPFDLARETTPALQAAGRLARRRALHAKCGAWRAVIEARLAAGQPNPYGSAAGLRAAFWRTLIADRDQAWMGPPPDDFGRGLTQFLASDGDDEAPPPAAVLPYLVPAVSRLARRAFVVTARGYLGLMPGLAARGDDICVLEGGKVPFVLRRTEGDVAAAVPESGAETMTRYKWVGEAYVHGIMQGEWVAELERRQGRSPDLVGFVVN